MLPKQTTLDGHDVVSPREWLDARKALLEKEVALTHELDRLHAERRALPWVRVDKEYMFEGRDGAVTLGGLFDGRRQLVIQHFMLSPGKDSLCQGCSFIADHVDAARRHFEQAGLSYAAVSRAPISQIEKARARMGWSFPWVSSDEGDFSYDFNVAFTEADRADGGAPHNFGKERIRNAEDMFGVSVFVRPDDGGEIFHSYSAYRRGAEPLMGALNWLDLTPLGRNEQGETHRWLRLHDEY